MKFKQFLIESVLFVSADDYMNYLIPLFKNVKKFNNTIDFVNFINEEILFYSNNMIFLIQNIDKIEARYNFVENRIKIIVPLNFYELIQINLKKTSEEIKRNILHELVHKEQMEKVSFDYIKNNSTPPKIKDKKSSIKYMKHTHELMAYAIEIANKLLYVFKDKYKALEFLKNPKPGVSKELELYILTFKKKPKILRQLYKYIYLYLLKG